MNSAFHIPHYAKIFETLHDKQLSHFWVPSKSDKFSTDLSDWKQFPVGIQRRIKSIVRLLTVMEPCVVENADDISSMIKKTLDPKVVEELGIVFLLINTQICIEGVHILSYFAVNNALKYDGPLDGMQDFLDAKVNVVSKWRTSGNKDMDPKKALSLAIVANVMSEGLIFNEAFNIFLYLKKKGLLKETVFVNEEVRFDENLHCETFATIYNVLTEKGYIPRLSIDEVHAMADDFVKVNDKTIYYLLGDLTSEEKDFFLIMNIDNSKKYCRILANIVLGALKYPPLYEYTSNDNPYSFTDVSLLNSMESFFDTSVSQYGLDVDNFQENESDPEDDE